MDWVILLGTDCEEIVRFEKRTRDNATLVRFWRHYCTLYEQLYTSVLANRFPVKEKPPFITRLLAFFMRRRSLCSDRRTDVLATRLATLWATKEAVMKLLGTGAMKLGRSHYAGEGLPFDSIELRHAGSGRPFVKLYGKAAERAAALGISDADIAVTASHAGGLVTVNVACLAPKDRVLAVFGSET